MHLTFTPTTINPLEAKRDSGLFYVFHAYFSCGDSDHPLNYETPLCVVLKSSGERNSRLKMDFPREITRNFH